MVTDRNNTQETMEIFSVGSLLQRGEQTVKPRRVMMMRSKTIYTHTISSPVSSPFSVRVGFLRFREPFQGWLHYYLSVTRHSQNPHPFQKSGACTLFCYCIRRYIRDLRCMPIFTTPIQPLPTTERSSKHATRGPAPVPHSSFPGVFLQKNWLDFRSRSTLTFWTRGNPDCPL